MLLQMEAFADAAEGLAPVLIPPSQMLDNIAAFEAVLAALESDAVVELDPNR